MTVSRETIMIALFDRFKSKMKPTIKSFSRRFQMPSQLSGSAEQPHLMLCKPKETYPPRVTIQLPPTRTFYPDVTVWLQNGQNQQSIPDTFINNLMDLFDTALEPDPGEENLTLGGLVYSCYIEGDITLVPGDVDGSGLLHFPLKIVVP